MIDLLSEITPENLLPAKKRLLGRVLTAVESGGAEGKALMRRLLPQASNQAHIIGLTGAPGTGKSTVTDHLASLLLEEGRSVGILAVDPSSPFSGGAILGDRIRMSSSDSMENCFIRSLATRGALGGLSAAVRAHTEVLKAFGFDYILIETVGVGQSEVDIAAQADTVVMVTMPGTGDDVQALKAGVMEIGDIFAVNKSDLDGADKKSRLISAMLDLNEEDSWRPPVLNLVSVGGLKLQKGADELLGALREHKAFLEETGEMETKKRRRMGLFIEELALDMVKGGLKSQGKELQNFIDQVMEGRQDPEAAAKALLYLAVYQSAGIL